MSRFNEWIISREFIFILYFSGLINNILWINVYVDQYKSQFFTNVSLICCRH